MKFFIIYFFSVHRLYIFLFTFIRASNYFLIGENKELDINRLMFTGLHRAYIIRNMKLKE